MTGYVLIHRNLIGNPQFRGKDDEYAAMWLVLHAAWDAVTVRVSREAVALERGQCAYAMSFLAEAWECSKATAHARVRHLESVGFIKTRPERGYTVITVCKYREYQATPNAARTQDETPSERHPNAARTNKNEGNKDSDSSLRSESPPEAPQPQAENLFAILEEQAEPSAPAVDLDALFEQWWEQFPRYRRGSKGPARKKWLSLVKRKAATSDELMDGLRRYLAAGYGESQYACGAERWLNDERWTIESFPIPGDVESAAQQAHGDTHGAFRHDRSHRPASRNGFCALVLERAGVEGAERAGEGADRRSEHPGDGERGRGVPDQVGAFDLDSSEWRHG